MATAKFFGRYKQSSRHQTWSAAWVTPHAPPLVEASENIHHAQFLDGASPSRAAGSSPTAAVR
jgi:hypothetical protein